MRDLKISVVVAIYNVGPYLERCLSSIVGQTYTNLEIICVDDGSTDHSGEICDSFAAKDPRITVIHKENGGVSTARNVGIEGCTGEFISFIDGDDWLEPNMYEVLVGNITAEDIDVSACGYFEDEGDISKPVVNLLPVPEEPMDTREFLKYIYVRDKYRGVASYLWSRLFRRELITDRPIEFDPEIHISEDQIFTAQCYLASKRSVYTSKPMYHYVQRKSSAMHDPRQRLKGLHSCVAFQKVIDLYEEHGIEPSIVDYVKRFYVYHTSVLLRMAIACGAKDKIAPLKENIRKYFDVYCRTNGEYPERVKEVRQLLERVYEGHPKS